MTIPKIISTLNWLVRKVSTLSSRVTTLEGSSGSGGSQGYYLSSPDTTVWQLGISNLGAITATTVTGQTGVPSISLTSPDNSVWTITINNNGVLSQTKP